MAIAILRNDYSVEDDPATIKRYRILKVHEFDLPNPKKHIYTEYNDDTALSTKRKARYDKVAKSA